jgi:hypothetical protein
MQDEKLTNRHKQILRFVLFIKLFDLQYPTFYKEVAGKFKQRLNNFTNHLHQVRTIFENNANPEVAEYLDNTSAIAWEVLDELDKAPDKAMFLTICKCYNEGLIRIEDEQVPVNSKQFQDYLKVKGEAA